MGYNTRYALNIVQEDEQEEFLDRLGVVTEQIPTISHHEQICKRYDTWFNDSIKWYSYDEDMREYSAEYPDLLFELSGEGEESGDIWRAYFKDGLRQRVQARVVFEDYDENLLR